MRLDGKTVLDIGTTNGGAAFVVRAARRQAGSWLSTSPTSTGSAFAAIREFLGSSAQHVRASILRAAGGYSASSSTSCCSGACSITFAIRCSHSTTSAGWPAARSRSRQRSRITCWLPRIGTCPWRASSGGAEYAGDSSNWFAPNVVGADGLVRVVRPRADTASGLGRTRRLGPWSIASATEPEWPSLSYEQPLICSADASPR